jgi:hypothetical protein
VYQPGREALLQVNEVASVRADISERSPLEGRARQDDSRPSDPMIEATIVGFQVRRDETRCPWYDVEYDVTDVLSGTFGLSHFALSHHVCHEWEAPPTDPGALVHVSIRREVRFQSSPISAGD